MFVYRYRVPSLVRLVLPPLSDWSFSEVRSPSVHRHPRSAQVHEQHHGVSKHEKPGFADNATLRRLAVHRGRVGEGGIVVGRLVG